VLNVKNIDLCLNPGQGLIYDIWEQSRKYDYPIPSTGLSVNYPVPGGVDSTFINPQPRNKTFFEFTQTFWQNMINARNRQYITDGKTGGYPTLQSLFWKYLEQLQTIGISNNNYTYQKLIDYVNGINPNWMKLVDQMIPATTIWQGGVKYENSILHRQKFAYRRQRGCQLISVPANPCSIVIPILPTNCPNDYVQLFIYPWLNGSIQATNFSSILYNRLNAYLSTQGLTIATCNRINTLQTTWYVDIRLNNQILVQQNFFNGVGLNGVPSNLDWKIALINNLPRLNSNGLSYYLDINTDKLTVRNTLCNQRFLNQNFTLNVGISINLTC
jgi:hypothetical protein